MHHAPRAGQLWGIVLAAGDGTRVRTFLSNLCGNRGIKQFCTIIGRRSMLEHTLARVEMLIPRQRIIIVVSGDHQPEIAQHLAHWPSENVIVQPENRDTTAGILLPLIYIAKRDSTATVAIFPSDHFIAEEQRFMDFVRYAVSETHRFPESFILLGVTPDRIEDGYGWIEAANGESDRVTRAVTHFGKNPPCSRQKYSGGEEHYGTVGSCH